jgi:phosphate starvation-inducible PhoH-like protein
MKLTSIFSLSFLFPLIQSSKIQIYKPNSANQIKYTNALHKNAGILVVSGPAGTGKTLHACQHAIQCLKEKSAEKIIITRPIMTVEEELGFLPGSVNKKMEPWTKPLFDVFEEYYSKKQLSDLVNQGTIEISPLAFMRGRTFKNAIIIADEMQNSSPKQMLMLLTRLGTNSKMVITGDLEQSDKMENNGLKDIINKLNSIPYSQRQYIDSIELDKNDVQRSAVVSSVLELYSPQKTLTRRKRFDISYNSNNDAALIPKSHLTKELE